MKKITVFSSLLLIFALILSSCALLPTAGDEQTEGLYNTDTNAVQTEAETEKEKEPFTVTFYTDPASAEFLALGDGATVLDGAWDAGENDLIRFVCSEDGCDVLLEAVSYYPALDFFYPYMPVFSTSTNAGTVYEFACPFAETIPAYRLSAEKDGYRAVWFPVFDGENNDCVTMIRSEEAKAAAPEEDDPIVTLCRVYANNSVKGGADVSSLPELFWNTAAESLFALETEANGETPTEELRVEEWVVDSVAGALFPGENYPGIGDTDSIEYTTEYNERYIVYPDFGDVTEQTEFISSALISDDSAEVVIGVPSDTGYATVHVTLDYEYDSEDPFAWHIRGMEFFTD